jgi:hypothetical protein
MSFNHQFTHPFELGYRAGLRVHLRRFAVTATLTAALVLLIYGGSIADVHPDLVRIVCVPICAATYVILSARIARQFVQSERDVKGALSRKIYVFPSLGVFMFLTVRASSRLLIYFAVPALVYLFVRLAMKSVNAAVMTLPPSAHHKSY